MHEGIELFLSLLEVCNSKVPEQYREEYPGIFIRVLLILNAAPLLSQTEVARRVGIKQSRFSKLATKLWNLRLIESFYSDEDRRFHVLKISEAGKDWLDSLEPELLARLTAEQIERES
jgi:DNA-binding MarR family transcriptional regulator